MYTWKRYEGANESNEEEKKLSLRQCKTHRGLQKRVNLLLHEATKDCINILQVNHSTIVQISFSNLLLDIDRPSGKVDAGQFLVTRIQFAKLFQHTRNSISEFQLIRLDIKLYRIRKKLVPKKVSVSVSKFLGIKKKYRF